MIHKVKIKNLEQSCLPFVWGKNLGRHKRSVFKTQLSSEVEPHQGVSRRETLVLLLRRKYPSQTSPGIARAATAAV